ncbi:SAM-dependent methyltransferase [Chryseobacterium lactis]|uniref:S-adenosyl-L-methionine-dependent methyltransferase n=1 Tax=Chryseobacterium lactis TaxID=1241981 RepID=A0A3G6RKG8_CHRLC|nr:class I SAM-dependent methyltransferase [Chryseobacterium lactis]AZA80470.1 SAM-dependent methyltransferase [Chryseobacterium lactis]AZB05472.1 SAM-dependent methyltransferase [Chryseobacterium lactis]PNW11393.1 SAM-dependent methyltransferase [Chryseobacterium lactis]
MESYNTPKPDNTAVRTALWRALHVQKDAAPYILEDTIGLQLVSPEEGWQERPDMKYTRRLRASIVARSRFIEDLMIKESEKGIKQYIILGAGLDTFAQRRTDVASQLQIYEIDQPETLAWKQSRLSETGFQLSDNLHFVPVDFEISSWWEELVQAGFNIHEPAVIVCTGVTLYLTREAISTTLQQIATLAPGSKLAMSFYLPIDLLDEEDQPMQEIAEKGAKESGTPFVSFFAPYEVLLLAQEAGFERPEIISTNNIKQLYFSDRTDDLQPASGEVFLLAST